jgi:divalent metal cation (Fe/Co/Zn/Cd) transporter
MRWIGHEIHAEAELDVDATTTLGQAHDLAHRAEADLVRATPRLTTAVVPAYPAHHDELVHPPA